METGIKKKLAEYTHAQMMLPIAIYEMKKKRYM